jgi:hypothetical protein
MKLAQIVMVTVSVPEPPVTTPLIMHTGCWLPVVAGVPAVAAVPTLIHI